MLEQGCRGTAVLTGIGFLDSRQASRDARGGQPIGANVSTIVLEQRKKEAKHGLSLVSLQKPKRDEGEKPCQADPIIRKNV
ncbi:hypothetical protein KSZ_49360 [Dictyobacter formicarum]|uniref:Uncharacterized protein n=1 Tax=Dictyobacter formicarum TaxID=2778368 RepID=A0ABQ3VL32_9CHLR|nr:hypothetical protein KSZ_49360 [Dictyobacter formicarum]